MRQRKFSKVEGGQKGGKLRVFEKRKGGIYKGGHCVTTTVILKHSCKLSRECFKFLKAVCKNNPKTDAAVKGLEYFSFIFLIEESLAT